MSLKCPKTVSGSKRPTGKNLALRTAPAFLQNFGVSQSAWHSAFKELCKNYQNRVFCLPGPSVQRRPVCCGLPCGAGAWVQRRPVCCDLPCGPAAWVRRRPAVSVQLLEAHGALLVMVLLKGWKLVGKVFRLLRVVIWLLEAVGALLGMVLLTGWGLGFSASGRCYMAAGGWGLLGMVRLKGWKLVGKVVFSWALLYGTPKACT